MMSVPISRTRDFTPRQRNSPEKIIATRNPFSHLPTFNFIFEYVKFFWKQKFIFFLKKNLQNL